MSSNCVQKINDFLKALNGTATTNEREKYAAEHAPIQFNKH